MPGRPDGNPPPASRVLTRPALAGVLAFMDAAQDRALDARGLAGWFSAYLVKPGIGPMPATAQEPGVGVVSLRDLPTGAWAPAYEDRLAAIVAAARLRISLAAQGRIALSRSAPSRTRCAAHLGARSGAPG